MADRIQRQRTKGWRMPPNTACVDRNTRFGNPFRVGRTYHAAAMFDDVDTWSFPLVEDAAMAVDLYRKFITQPLQKPFIETIKAELRGKNLACWCPCGQPCHADVLLEIANS